LTLFATQARHEPGRHTFLLLLPAFRHAANVGPRLLISATAGIAAAPKGAVIAIPLSKKTFRFGG